MSPKKSGKTRSLKVQSKYKIEKSTQNISTVPELTLCGKWLRKVGFSEGDQVSVHTFKGLIIIQPEQE